MSKKVILTGLRANNDLHIGNYFGALLPLVDMAKNNSDEFQINLFVPDLHSFTTPIDHSKLQEQIMNNLRLYAAAGLPLDDNKVHIYRQSRIPAHSELTVILNSFTGMGELSRMTQFKDKASKSVREQLRSGMGAVRVLHGRRPGESSVEEAKDRVSVGLFDYPVLMAADILLYGATYVPVGDDQSQHLEFTRDVADRFNNKFGDVFTTPAPVKAQHEFFNKDQGLRIKDLADPTRKMSKSEDTDKGVIFLSDDPEKAVKKIMSATTDDLATVHYDPEKQPGISNLLQIHALLAGEDLQTVIDHHDGDTSYGELKKEVAEDMKKFLADFQQKLNNIDEHTLLDKLEESESAMNKQANQVLHKVQKAVGLR